MSRVDYERVTALLQVGLCTEGPERFPLPHELPDLSDFGQVDETNRLVLSGDVIADDVSIEGYVVQTKEVDKGSFPTTVITVNIRFDLLVTKEHVDEVIGLIKGQPDGPPEDEDLFGPIVFDMFLYGGVFDWCICEGPRVLSVEHKEGDAL